MGWTPTEDDPVEWDEIERMWMRALNLYEATHICPLCGLDMSICHDENEFNKRYKHADVYLCFASQAREFALQKYQQSGLVEAPHSQTTKLVAREE